MEEDVGRRWTSVNVALCFFLPSLMLPSFRLARRNLNGRRSLPFTIRFAVMHLFPRGCFSFATHAPHGARPLYSVMMRH